MKCKFVVEDLYDENDTHCYDVTSVTCYHYYMSLPHSPCHHDMAVYNQPDRIMSVEDSLHLDTFSTLHT